MELLIPIVVVVGIVLLIRANARFMNKETRTLYELVAQRHEGVVQEGADYLTHQLHVSMHGVDVLVNVHTRHMGKGQVPFYTANIKLSKQHNRPSFKIRKKMSLRAMPARTIAQFTQRFDVKTNAQESLYDMLSEETMLLHLQHPTIEVACEDNELRVMRPFSHVNTKQKQKVDEITVLLTVAAMYANTLARTTEHGAEVS